MPAATFHALPIRSLVAATLLFALASGAWGQGPGGFGGSPAGPRPTAQKKTQRAVRGLTEFATDQTVTAIEVRGNRTVPPSRITGQMQTRVGRPYDPRTLAKDIKRLASLPYFVTVRPLTKSTEEGVVVVLEVVERSTIRYVEYFGNQRIKTKKLAQETGLAVGGAIDPYAVEEGRRRILQLYNDNGFGRTTVEVTEGSSPDDRGVIFTINEGPKTRVWSVDFKGNEFTSDGQLKQKVKTKPSLIRVYGNKFSEDELEADVQSLTSYYRAFGFFRARVGRTLEYDDSGKWATVTFVINEGPRYRVRNVTFLGNEKFTSGDLSTGMELKGGDFFERTKLSIDTNWLRDLYGSRGYIYASIEPETVFLEESGAIDLVYDIEEGERWRVGQIFVNINGESSHTRIQTALNRMSIKPGDILDTRELKASELRLKRSTIFNTNPAMGATPEIAYRVSDQTKKMLAERDSGRGDAARTATAQRRTAYKPPSGSVYSQQAPTAPPTQPTGWTGSAYPTTAQNGYAAQASPPPAAPPTYPAGYGGTTVGATSPAASPAGANATQVQQLGTAPPPGARPVTPTQYNMLNGALPQSVPQQPVNTQFFPTQVYAPAPVPSPQDPTADLYVNLEETQTGRFLVGVAVNSDAGLVGQIMLDERNFDWRAIPTSWDDWGNGTAFRGGGQRFRLEAAPGTEVQRYLASWQEPYLFDSPISLSLSGSYYDRRFDDWDERRTGGRIGLGYQWVDRDLTAQLTYRGESIDIALSDLYSPDGDPNTPDEIPEYDEMDGDNSLHGFGLRLISDKRDNPFLATEGCYVSSTFEYVTGSFDYARTEFDIRMYRLMRERPDHTGRHVLSATTRFGFTGGATPSYDRFYAGGHSTLRGFDFRGASPVRLGSFEVGGDFMFINSLEYLFPLTADGMVMGVAFVDHGTVSEGVDLNEYRVAPGVGLRLMVPAMGPAPIALDFAWPVSEEETDDTQVFTFNVGFQR